MSELEKPRIHIVPKEEDKAQLRFKIAEVEDEVRALPQIEVPIENYFSHKVYAREMKLKARELIVGKIHRYHNLNILSEGEVSILSVDGVKRVKAPFTFVGSPGAKRVIFAHTDVTWTTIHGTAETDVDKIEEEFIAKDYAELELTELELKLLKGEK